MGLEIPQRGSAVPTFLRDKSRAPRPPLVCALNTYSQVPQGLLHELAGHRIAALPWESGTEKARTPNADASSDDSAAREAFGVRPIYRRFLSGATLSDSFKVHGPKAREKWRGDSEK